MLKEKLGPSVNLMVVVFGLPRVGTSKWADFVREEVCIPSIVHRCCLMITIDWLVFPSGVE